VVLDATPLAVFAPADEPWLIKRNSRIEELSPGEMAEFLQQIELAASVRTTGHVIGEAALLFGRFSGQSLQDSRRSLARCLRHTVEVRRPSRRIAEAVEYHWLGMADAGLLEAISACDGILISDDGRLRSAAMARGQIVFGLRMVA
jgi:hypothetical protein